MEKLIAQVQAMFEESGDKSVPFNAAEWVASWLEKPSPALGFKKPSEFMDTTAGQKVVADLLARMQSGAYS